MTTIIYEGKWTIFQKILEIGKNLWEEDPSEDMVSELPFKIGSQRKYNLEEINKKKGGERE